MFVCACCSGADRRLASLSVVVQSAARLHMLGGQLCAAHAVAQASMPAQRSTAQAEARTLVVNAMGSLWSTRWRSAMTSSDFSGRLEHSRQLQFWQ